MLNFGEILKQARHTLKLLRVVAGNVAINVVMMFHAGVLSNIARQTQDQTQALWEAIQQWNIYC